MLKVKKHSMSQNKYEYNIISYASTRGLVGLVVSALNFQAGYHGFESRSGQDNFQTISTPSSYSTCPGLSIKWTGRRLMTDTKYAWVIHGSKAVQIHVHNNRHCLYVPHVPGSIKNPYNNNASKKQVPPISSIFLSKLLTIKAISKTVADNILFCLLLLLFKENKS